MSDVAPPPNEFGLAGVGRDARFLIPPVESPPTPPTGEIWDLGGAALGGGWRAQVVVPPGSDPQALRSACQQAFDAVGAVLDHWTPTSEVARFNAAPAGSWSLSKPFWEDLNLALNLADETDGAFDPTLGALVDLWGFGPAGRRDVLSPTPGAVQVTVLSVNNNGVPTAGELASVSAELNNEDVRPLTDNVTVQAAGIVTYAITATIFVNDGPDSSVVLANCQTAAQTYATARFKIGADVNLSGIYAALHQPGVEKVVLTSPSANLDITPTQAGRCTAITLTLG